MYEDDRTVQDEAPGGLSGMSILTVVLPFAATIASLLFGILIGGVAGWLIKPTQQPIEYLRTASLAELALVCEPVVQEQKTQLAEVKQEIEVLRIQVAEKEAEVADLKARAEKQGSRKVAVDGRDYSGELSSAKEQLAEARLQLKMMEQVKNQLVEQLTRTQEKLVKAESDLAEAVAVTDVLRDENTKLQDDVIVQRWFRFVADAQLEVCEKGNKKKTDECRDAVGKEVSAVKREFVHCVRSGQAVPVAKLLAKGTALPHFARMMNQDDKHLEGWYLQMCDPTLPEKELPEVGAPSPAPPPITDLDDPT